MSEKKPEVVYFPAHRTFCPVCGKASYSRSGEHPQCAVARADAVFKARQVARAKKDLPKREPHPVKRGNAVSLTVIKAGPGLARG